MAIVALKAVWACKQFDVWQFDSQLGCSAASFGCHFDHVVEGHTINSAMVWEPIVVC